MSNNPDVIIGGLGAVGSAALYQLSRLGVRSLGIDRHVPPHRHGSSHGETRITRIALGEGPQYVQFARRSHEIWRELEAQTSLELLHQVGGLIYGSRQDSVAAHGALDFLQTTIDVARTNGIPHEVLDVDQLRTRFPQFHFQDGDQACFEPGAGYLRPERCIETQLQLAKQNGAKVLTGETLLEWWKDGEGVVVKTSAGVHRAAALILSAGSWIPQLAPLLASRVKVFRQTLHWFETLPPFARFQPSEMPVFIRVPDRQTAMFYGFPAVDGEFGGIKIAGEQFDRVCEPDFFQSDVGDSESDAVHRLVSPHLFISPRCIRAVACKYTVTPDFQFLIDQHPDSDRVWIASACSGHGFKHSAAVGEALARSTAGMDSGYDLSPFDVDRLGLRL